MPILRNLLSTPEKRFRGLSTLGGTTTNSGFSVSPERSLHISAVYACVRLISEAIGSLPVDMFQRFPDSRKRLDQDPVGLLITDRPNPNLDAAEFWRIVIGFMALRGNAFVFVERNGGGRPIGLWPIAPSSVEVKRQKSDGLLAYKVILGDDEWAPIPADGVIKPGNMLHYRAFGTGAVGLSPVGLARETIAIGASAQGYVAGFFKRDASPGGLLEVEGKLDDDQYSRLTEQWSALHEGTMNSHKLAILEGGAKWSKVSLAPADAQFLEVQKFSRSEIASFFGVPPFMIGDTEKSTSWGTGIEQQGIGWVTYGLTPWLVRLEQVTKQILGKGQYLKWQTKALLRGDTAARFSGYAQGRQWGWYSANDVRRFEDEDPIKGGDEYLVPTNMLPAGQVAPTALRSVRMMTKRAEQPKDAEPGAVQDITAILITLFEKQRSSALKNGSMDPTEWNEELAAALLPVATQITASLGPAAAAAFDGTFDLELALPWLQAWADRQALNINFTTAAALAVDIDSVDEADTDKPNDVQDAVNKTFDNATDFKAALLGAALTGAVGWFARTEGSKQAGALMKEWRTGKNARASHARMDGERVPIGENFSNGMKWPRDRAGGIDEVAGCNCELEFSKETS